VIDWTAVLTTSTTATGIVAVLAFAAKAVFQHSLDADLERYKNDLRAATDAEAIRLRAELELVASEHSVKFAALHATRAKIIAFVHAQLLRLSRDVETVLVSRDLLKHPEAHVATLYERIADRTAKLQVFLEPRSIYLDAATYKAIKDVVNTLMQATERDYETETQAQVEAGTDYRGYGVYLDRFLEQVPALLAQLQDQFRKMLGVR
jgi:hypothetical protein